MNAYPTSRRTKLYAAATFSGMGLAVLGLVGSHALSPNGPIDRRFNPYQKSPTVQEYRITEESLRKLERGKAELIQISGTSSYYHAPEKSIPPHLVRSAALLDSLVASLDAGISTTRTHLQELEQSPEVKEDKECRKHLGLINIMILAIGPCIALTFGSLTMRESRKDHLEYLAVRGED